MSAVETRGNLRSAKGKWMKHKIDCYAECKTKFSLTNAEIASIMNIPEQSVMELSKMIATKEVK